MNNPTILEQLNYLKSLDEDLCLDFFKGEICIVRHYPPTFILTLNGKELKEIKNDKELLKLYTKKLVGLTDEMNKTSISSKNRERWYKDLVIEDGKVLKCRHAGGVDTILKNKPLNEFFSEETLETLETIKKKHDKGDYL